MSDPGGSWYDVLRDGIVAGAWAGVVGGVPSTVVALMRAGDPLEATRAAGSMALPTEHRQSRLLPAGLIVHSAISAFWGVVLAAALPRRGAVAGAAAGGAIAALDLGLIGRRFRLIRELGVGPQLADHLVFGAVAGAVLARRRDR